MKRITRSLFLLLPLVVILFSLLKMGKKEKEKYSPKVTYTFSGGRFGDDLLAYLRAKWISYKYDLPLLYRPFPFSDQLGLNDLEQEFFEEGKYENEIYYTNDSRIQPKKYSKPTVYVIPYFPESFIEIQVTQDWQYFQVDWKDPGFRKEIEQYLIPNFPIKQLSLPENYATLAVHVRTGRGYDSETAWKDAPVKFPPMSYYSDQVNRISQIIGPDKIIYVRIFTDDPEPETIRDKLQKSILEKNVEFHILPQEQTSVLGDFFHMMQYDYLIRAESNLSILASLLKDYKICVSPKHYFFENNQITIDQANWVFNEPMDIKDNLRMESIY